MTNIYSIKEAVEIITLKTGKSVSLRQVQHECYLGHIKAEKKGKFYLIEPSNLDDYISKKLNKNKSKSSS